MREQQKEINDWEVVKELIDRNVQPRINWKSLIGDSLTATVAKYRNAGLTSVQIIECITFEHKDLTKEAIRRLKIGVCARCGEQKTAERWKR